MKKRKDSYKPWDPENLLDKSLSPRQLQILRLMSHGNTQREIGEKLGISPSTVKNHNYSTYKKLGAFDNAHAVAIAFRKGIIK